MNYIFGTNGQVETLKTKGDIHTDFKEFQQIIQTYPDQTITDRFRIVNKYRTDEDAEGNCYDWYEIDRHYRTVDKTGPLIAQAEDTDLMLADQEYRLTLLELGMTENGG